MIPWFCGESVALNVTIPDRFAQSHPQIFAFDWISAGNAAEGITIKNSDVFQVAIETRGSLNQLVVELVQDIGRSISAING